MGRRSEERLESGASRATRGAGPRRLAHGALLALYTLAALLGLFLHSSGESLRGHHVCAVRCAEMAGDESPTSPIHDEALCNLCHTFSRLAVAVPPPLSAVLPVALDGGALVGLPDAPRVARPVSVSHPRAPPSV